MQDDTPGVALVRAPILNSDEISRVSRIANNLGKSGMFPDAKNGYAAFAKILLGRDLGLGAMQSMTGIHVVEGKPMLAATTLAGFVRASEDYDYRVIRHDENVCEIEFGHGKAPGKTGEFEEDGEPIWAEWPESLGFSTFTIEEAQTAGLGSWPDKAKWGKSGWGKYPKNMLFARAMSNGVKWYAPDLFGGIPVYTEADEFAVRAHLTEGSEDGEAQGLDLGPEVEMVLGRAAELGHAGYADRAAVEMRLGGRSVDVILAWCDGANRDLNALAEARAAAIEAESDNGDAAEVPEDDEPGESGLGSEEDGHEVKVRP